MNWPYYVAQERRFFVEEDLAVEAKFFTSGQEPVTKLINGSLDVISVIPDVVLLEAVKGASLSIIFNTNSRSQYCLMVQPGIRNYADLKGEKIGVSHALSAESFIFKKLVETKGHLFSSFELVASGPPLKRCAGLKQGLFAATIVTQPFDFVLEEAEFNKLASSQEIVPHYPFTVCVVRRDEGINENVVRFLKSLKSAWHWLADPVNRESAVTILGQSTETGRKQAEKTYDLYLPSPSPPPLAPRQEGVATLLELLVDSGRLPSSVPPAKTFIDERYFQRL